MCIGVLYLKLLLMRLICAVSLVRFIHFCNPILLGGFA